MDNTHSICYFGSRSYNLVKTDAVKWLKNNRITLEYACVPDDPLFYYSNSRHKLLSRRCQVTLVFSAVDKIFVSAQ